MKVLIAILLTLFVTVVIALWAMEDPGYILIALGSWTVETTATLAIVLVLISFTVLYFILRMGSRLRGMPRGLRHWRRQRQQGRAQASLNKGLIELAEGLWPAAERKLIKFASQGQTPLLNYLAAARAAQAQGADGRRDHYLKLAHESHAGADIAVGLTQAELQLKQNQLEQSLATLRHLQQLAPKHSQVLKALASLYQQLGDWEHLIELLPALRKRNVMTVEVLDGLARQAYVALLQVASGSVVEQVWSRVDKDFREDKAVLQAYVQKLLEVDNAALAEPLVRKALKYSHPVDLIRLYGLIKSPDPVRQLSTVESLLAAHKNDATVLLTAGRLSLRNRLWGKARSYLEASINSQPMVEAYNELGNLLDQLGEREAAAECFHAGLRLVPGCEYPVASAIPKAQEPRERMI